MRGVLGGRRGDSHGELRCSQPLARAANGHPDPGSPPPRASLVPTSQIVILKLPAKTGPFLFRILSAHRTRPRLARSPPSRNQPGPRLRPQRPTEALAREAEETEAWAGCLTCCHDRSSRPVRQLGLGKLEKLCAGSKA